MKIKAPNRLPIAISTPSSLSLNSIEFNISGAPLENAIKLSAAILGGNLSRLEIDAITVDRY